VAALFAVTFSISNPFAAFGVFLPILSETFGWSRGAISVAVSLNLLIGGLLGLVLGTIADRRGPRVPLTVTVAMAGAGFGLASTVNSLWQFYLFVGVLGGVGMSGFYVLSATTISRWFTRRRGLALGIVLMGFNLGYMTGGPLAAWLIERVGWRGAYVALGTAVLVVGGLASLIVRYPAVSPVASSQPVGRAASSGVEFRRAIGESRLWLLCVSWLLQGFVLLTLSVHIVPYARDRGVSLESASLALTAYGIGAALGRLGFGGAVDRFGTVATMRLCFVVELLALVPLLIAPRQGVLLLLFLGFGLGFAGADTVFTRSVPEVFGLRAVGAIMGILTLGWRAGAALGPAAAGFIHDATGSYAIPFGVAPPAVVIGFALFTCATRAAPRRRARPMEVSQG
jgi:MFS transporter, OFA family, oxalate/formate antiporter